MILIAAMTRDRVIGRADGLPWSIPEEYASFLEHVRGNAVVLGRRSYEIFGPDLDAARMVVVSRSIDALPDADVRPDVASAIAHARSLDTAAVFSAGGATIYRQTLPFADAMYLSIVKGSFEGDVRFPRWSPDDWQLEHERDHAAFVFKVFRRRTRSSRPPAAD